MWTLPLLATALSAAPAQLTVEPAQATPGDALLLTVQGASEPPWGELGARRFTFFPHQGRFRAVIGLPVELPAGPLELTVRVRGADGTEHAATATVELREPTWPARELKVAGRFVDPPPEVQARIEADRKAFAEAFARPVAAPLFAGNFGWPRKARITARFGDLRTFNGTTQSQHFGTDLAGAVGAPIHATNDGVVVMVRDAYTSGKTVIVHHGQELYSLYFHLSKIAVAQGARVKKGRLLGQVGGTGRVTGPHLHWSMKVGDLYVDPESVLRLRFAPPPPPRPRAPARETAP